jgi:glycerol-3-phosphate dehydrogenase subunit C
VLYATCFVNDNPGIGEATRAVLAKNGVATEVAYPRCCGMPQLEQGDIARVAETADEVAAALGPYIEQGYDVVALVPSCALMVKFEWPHPAGEPGGATPGAGDRRQRIHRRHR